MFPGQLLHVTSQDTTIHYYYCNCVLVVVDDDDDDGGGGGRKGDLNPFSYKRFVSDDLASRNKRVLQVFDQSALTPKT